jgi:hypothetical protein
MPHRLARGGGEGDMQARTHLQNIRTSGCMAEQRYIVRYALAEEPVPTGWDCRPMQGHHGAEGRVIHSKRVDEDADED